MLFCLTQRCTTRNAVLAIAIFGGLILSSCENKEIKWEYVAQTDSVTRDFRTFWNYWNEHVLLSEDFDAVDTGGTSISRRETITLLTTGRYIPMRYKTVDSSFRYKLFALPGNIESNIPSTIRQMATIEFAYLQLEGKLLPQFNFTDINGIKVDTNFIRNNFLVAKCWFIRCAPCEKQRPAYEALMEKYSGKNISFVTFADDKKDALLEFSKLHNIYYPIVPEQAEYIRNVLGLSLYPTYIVAGPDGKVLKVVNDIGLVSKILSEHEYEMKHVYPPAPPVSN